MITIVHGDDLRSSREFYTQQKQKHSSVTLDGTTLDLTSLLQALSGDGLFDDDKTVFIELLLSKRKKSKELDLLIKTLQSHSGKDILLWEGKELDKKTLSLFPNATVRPFKLPQVLFSFIDGLKPNNGIAQVRLFHQALENVEPEVLFAMLVRQIRLLLALSSHTSNPIEEVKRIAPWQEQKLKKQASLFHEEKLLLSFAELFEIDNQQKTGKSSLPLSSAIDIWLLKL